MSHFLVSGALFVVIMLLFWQLTSGAEKLHACKSQNEELKATAQACSTVCKGPVPLQDDTAADLQVWVATEVMRPTCLRVYHVRLDVAYVRAGINFGRLLATKH